VPDYSQTVADHFAHPRNAGIPSGDPETLFRGEAGDREQGVQVVFYIRAVECHIEAIGFQAYGCPHTIAACSLATERLGGEPIEALLAISPESLADALDLPIEKMGRMLVVQDTLRNCFATWDNRRSA
jgi:nitrogen fixation NifU-like protein